MKVVSKFFLNLILCLIFYSCNLNRNEDENSIKNKEEKKQLSIEKDSINTNLLEDWMIIEEDSIKIKKDSVIKEKLNYCSIILPKDKKEQKIIKENPLSAYYKKQEITLNQYSLSNKKPLQPKDNLIGRFNCGVITLRVSDVTGDHGYYLDGVVEETYENTGNELTFLVYKTSYNQVKNIEIGKKYKIHWIETVANLEPFNHGYERLFVVYKIEKAF